MRTRLLLLALVVALAGCGGAHETRIDAGNAAKLRVEPAAPPIARAGAKLQVVRADDLNLQLPSPDHKWLLSVRAGKPIALRDARTHDVVDTLSVVGSPSALGWSADSTTFAVGDMRGRVSVWDEFKHRTFDLTGVRSPVTAVALSPDKRLVVTAHADRTVRVWETRSRKQVARLKLPSAPFTLRFSA